MYLLTIGNPKTAKGEKLGYLTAILHLAPSALSGRNVCPRASPECIALCLNTAGRGGIFRKGEAGNAIQECRIRRTNLFFDDRPAFLSQLLQEITAHVRRARRHRLRPAVRLNGTSDLAWEKIAPELFQAFPRVTFYDYTKVASRMAATLPANYSLTFSRSETNGAVAETLSARGANVAVVFATKRSKALPATFFGVPVIDGDLTDLRFLDPRPVVVGLRAKGRARRPEYQGGFVVSAL